MGVYKGIRAIMRHAVSACRAALDAKGYGLADILKKRILACRMITLF